MTDHKMTVIRRYYDELFNQGRIDLLSELLHPDYVNHSPGSTGLPIDRDGVGMVVTALRRGFPDLHYGIDDAIVGETGVAARVTMTGTHLGDLFGMPPTGKRVEVQQMTFETFRHGRIIAHHRLTDDLSMLRQLDLLPAPAIEPQIT